jgi:thiol-disulfide isomerase/thioredoxin
MLARRNSSNRIGKSLRPVVIFIVVAATIGLALIMNVLSAAESKPREGKAPELVGITQWINSKPLALEKLKGKVVVLHFWTFGCINCRHNLPYYNAWRTDFSNDQLEIIGVHTPETALEGDAKLVATRVKELGIKYPVAIDSDYATWKAYKNRYWPRIYLIDKRGRVRFRWDGELEYQNSGGDTTIRAKVKELLSENNE